LVSSSNLFTDCSTLIIIHLHPRWYNRSIVGGLSNSGLGSTPPQKKRSSYLDRGSASDVVEIDFWHLRPITNSLCGLVVRVPGYRSRCSGFYSRWYRIFWRVCLERCPLSLVSTTEELRGRNDSCFCLEIREYDRGDQLRWPRDTPLSTKESWH
jgi:hypothetical protein